MDCAFQMAAVDNILKLTAKNDGGDDAVIIRVVRHPQSSPSSSQSSKLPWTPPSPSPFQQKQLQHSVIIIIIISLLQANDVHNISERTNGWMERRKKDEKSRHERGLREKGKMKGKKDLEIFAARKRIEESRAEQQKASGVRARVCVCVGERALKRQRSIDTGYRIGRWRRWQLLQRDAGNKLVAK